MPSGSVIWLLMDPRAMNHPAVAAYMDILHAGQRGHMENGLPVAPIQYGGRIEFMTDINRAR